MEIFGDHRRTGAALVLGVMVAAAAGWWLAAGPATVAAPAPRGHAFPWHAAPGAPGAGPAATPAVEDGPPGAASATPPTSMASVSGLALTGAPEAKEVDPPAAPAATALVLPPPVNLARNARHRHAPPTQDTPAPSPAIDPAIDPQLQAGALVSEAELAMPFYPGAVLQPQHGSRVLDPLQGRSLSAVLESRDSLDKVLAFYRLPRGGAAWREQPPQHEGEPTVLTRSAGAALQVVTLLPTPQGTQVVLLSQQVTGPR